MNGGPFRGTRPADRGAAARPQAVPRQPEETHAIAEQPRPVHRAAPVAVRPAYNEEQSVWRRLVWPIVIVIVIVIIGVGGWLIWSNTQSNAAIIVDKNKYQAVFFTNGQVYFGKLQQQNGGYMKLTDIYYLQSQQQASTDEKDSKNPQQTSTDQNNVQLIKLGDEIHGPEDEMIISKDQVLFYENLKTDGKVAQSIEKYKSSGK